MSTKFTSIALGAGILLAGFGTGLQVNAAPAADECLAAPNSPAPQGSRWHYRTDRAKQRKCWYLRSQDQAAQQSAPQLKSEAAQPIVNDTTNEATKSAADKSELAPSTSAFVPQPSAGNASPAAPVAAPPAVATPQPAVPDGGAMAASAPKPAVQEITPVAPDAGSPAAGVKWPTPAPSVGAVNAPASNPAVAPAAGAPSPSPAQAQKAPSKPEPSAASADWTRRLMVTTPTGMFLIVAIGLMVAGILSRAVIRIAAARRNRVYVDRREQDWREQDWREQDWREQDWVDYIPPEDAPSISVRPIDLAQAPPERLRPNEDELGMALQQFLRDHDRRVA